MPAFTASAPGKAILFGEHAVVYGQPAIAAPVTQVCARATVTANIRDESGQVMVDAPDIGLKTPFCELSKDDPIATAIDGVMRYLKVARLPACTLKITSTIPVASGLGSGAAVTVAITRAMAGFLGQPLPDEIVSELAYEVEVIHHGTPSGIDNTVITYAKPVFFAKRQPIEVVNIKEPFTILIGDTGISSPTKETVGDVRVAWEATPNHYEQLFKAIGNITRSARQAIKTGNNKKLGPLMDENHQILQEMGVSSPELDRLVATAKEAGALGAKLSGGGRGGNMIALVDERNAGFIREAVGQHGAVNIIITNIQ